MNCLPEDINHLNNCDACVRLLVLTPDNVPSLEVLSVALGRCCCTSLLSFAL